MPALGKGKGGKASVYREEIERFSIVKKEGKVDGYAICQSYAVGGGGEDQSITLFWDGKE